MKTLQFKSREEWLQARVGKVTGSKLGDIVMKRGGGYKKGFYELIAERVAVPDEADVPTSPMDRGTFLEPKALDILAAKIKKEVNPSLVMWVRDDNENIAISPDGTVGKTEAAEVKCLSSASHIEAYLTKEIPSEYQFQKLQYFIVNDKLKKLYFCFYDPRIVAMPFFFIEVNRKDIEKEIAEYLDYEQKLILEVERITAELSF